MFYDTTPFSAAESGYRIAFRPGEHNVCPGCGQSHWAIGRMTAECAFCATALPINHGGRVAAGSFSVNEKRKPLAA